MRRSILNFSALGLLMLGSSPLISGCASCPIPASPHAGLLQSQSPSNLDDVHVIFVESPADVGHWGRLEEVCCSLRQLGLQNAIYFEPIVDGDSCDLVEQIRDIRDENPNSRIMLVGWSMGALCVKDALVTLDRCGEGVETVVYIDSGFLALADFTGHPNNVDRVLLIYRAHKSPPRCIPNAEVQCVDAWFHLSVPHHRITVDQIVQEAVDLAADGNPTRPFSPVVQRSE